ncbi:MAG: hypothetical protein ABSH46_19025 [Bryobacteraceae bacterium]|jgi:hypothetical protein
MTPAHSPGWQNPRILLTLAVVFLCGVMVGIIVHHWMHVAPPPPPGPTAGPGAALLTRLKTELDLTPGQTEQLKTVLDDFFTYYYTLQAQLDDVRASGKQRIERILDDGQKKKFERIMTEQDKRLH